MRKHPIFYYGSSILLLISLIVYHPSHARSNQPSNDANKEIKQGGETTHFKPSNRHAFSLPASNLPFRQRLDFKLGNSIFKKLWVPSPSSTTASDGLGPLYNARSCMQCHVRDGRGHTPKGNWPDDNAVSLLLRLSITPQNESHELALNSGRLDVIPEPTYGTQLQDFAATGAQAEGRIHINYTEKLETLADGKRVSLRQPNYSIDALGYGPLHTDIMISPRIAPPMIGLGLLENIPEESILALSDPQDLDNNGISGKPNQVWDKQTESTTLGRFGWKAGSPNLHQQNNTAFNIDIGISTPYAVNPYGECTKHQTNCLSMTHGNSPHHEGFEASSDMTNLLLFYTRHIAVPARRNADKPDVLAGKRVFYKSGCADCHHPSFTTAKTPTLPALSNQLIWPYTDLLLHDMGEGLADNRPEYNANGLEWRTPPLWGIGLTKIISGQTHYLHDGRARTLLEAILWHGGEAESAKQTVKKLPTTDRDNLIKFLESL